MNPIQFFKRWKKGIMNLTPLQLLHAELVGYIGNIFGMTFALVFLLFNGMWYFTIFMIFATFLQAIQYISTKQKYDNMAAIMGSMQDSKTPLKNSEELLSKVSK